MSFAAVHVVPTSMTMSFFCKHLIAKVLILSMVLVSSFVFGEANDAEQSWLIRTFGESLEMPNGKTISPTELEGKMLGLYFSGQGCGWCRRFTPRLLRFRNSLQSLGVPFEVILVSEDGDSSKMAKHIKEEHLPFPAIPYDSIKRIKLIKNKVKPGIPILEVLGKNGEVIVKDGRFHVEREYLLAYFSWRYGLPNISDYVMYFLPQPSHLSYPGGAREFFHKLARLAILCLVVTYAVKGIRHLHNLYASRRRPCANE